MARYEALPGKHVDQLEFELNSTFDRLIDLLNQRRVHLLTELSDRRGESRARRNQRDEMINQIRKTKSQVELSLKENPLKHMQQNMIAEMEKKLEELEGTTKELRLVFESTTEPIEEMITKLGTISEDKTIHYEEFQPIIRVAKQGNAPGELDKPENLAIDESTGNIFVVEAGNKRVSVFSHRGEFITFFGQEHLSSPKGIAIHGNHIYISDIGNNSVLHYELIGLKLLERLGGAGSEIEEFWLPYQLAVHSSGAVFVADCGKDRIKVLTFDLNFKRMISHSSLTAPIDLKFSRELLYVLSGNDNPCLHVFTLLGDKIRSLITYRSEQKEIYESFCIDPDRNLILSEKISNSIKILSPDGALLHTLGQRDNEKGMFLLPTGVAITKDGKLICVSYNENYGIQIFC